MTVLEYVPAVLTLLFLLAMSFVNHRWLESRPRRFLTVALLFPATAFIQAGWQGAAPAGYGLAKWPIATYNPGSSGYFSHARDEIDDLGDFVREYPDWIKDQDVLHTGTHPPGLFVEARVILDYWRSHAADAPGWISKLPTELREAAKAAKPGGMPIVEQASVLTIAMIRWLACAMTVWPIYAISRRFGHAPLVSYRMATLWAVVPSAVLFQPASDLLFPVLAASAVGLSVLPVVDAGWRHRWADPIIAGLILALGMFFSLVFLAIGAIVALVVISNRNAGGVRQKIIRISMIGAGFVLGTAAWAIAGRTDPLAIWLTNQAKHAGFYAANARSYGPWLMADFVESAIGLGLPIFVVVTVGMIGTIFRRDRFQQNRVAIATCLLLATLAISGRSLSEVGRLWLPFFPLLLTATIFGTSYEKAEGWLYRWILVWSGIQIVWLQTIVQCVYPI
jgi:hypothetical protein